MLILQIVIFYKIVYEDEVNTKCCTQIWKTYTCNVKLLLTTIHLEICSC